MRLILCPGCQRHVHAGEAECPFCDGALPCAAGEASPQPRGVSRARRYALNAALASGIAAATGCGSTSTPGPGDAATEAGNSGDSGNADGSKSDGAVAEAGADAAPTDTGAPDNVVCCPPYGCVFPDACAAVSV